MDAKIANSSLEPALPSDLTSDSTSPSSNLTDSSPERPQTHPTTHLDLPDLISQTVNLISTSESNLPHLNNQPNNQLNDQLSAHLVSDLDDFDSEPDDSYLDLDCPVQSVQFLFTDPPSDPNPNLDQHSAEQITSIELITSQSHTPDETGQTNKPDATGQTNTPDETGQTNTLPTATQTASSIDLSSLFRFPRVVWSFILFLVSILTRLTKLTQRISTLDHPATAANRTITEHSKPIFNMVLATDTLSPTPEQAETESHSKQSGTQSTVIAAPEPESPNATVQPNATTDNIQSLPYSTDHQIPYAIQLDYRTLMPIQLPRRFAYILRVA